MTVNRVALELFYAVSSLWRPVDQRYLGAIGFEFELAEHAFNELNLWCIANTDYKAEKWSLAENSIASAAIHARAFIDHAVRVQRLFKAMAGPSGGLANLAENFHKDNIDLFNLRNAIHHLESRIIDGYGIDQQHPPCGDFSWKSATPPTTLDTYWVSFGPMLTDEIATPEVCTTMTIRTPIDQLIYRVHGVTADLGGSFLALCRFMEAAHLRLVNSMQRQITEIGDKFIKNSEEKAPQGFHGRLRVQGLEMAFKVE